jgi:pyridoxine 5-phosphate synthase
MATKLSVNVNKIATLRNARGGNVPDVLACVKHLEQCGAEGITVHPRPDERHITQKDVYDIAKNISVEFNIEGYPDERYLMFIKDVCPAQATLVPDPPHVITSNAGWQVNAENLILLEQVIHQIKKNSPDTRVSVFIYPEDVSEKDLISLKNVGVDRIELYTGPYAEHYTDFDKRKHFLEIYFNTSEIAQKTGLGINAGHDLNLVNLPDFIKTIPFIQEVSIGQAFIADSLYYGFEETILRYKLALRPY